MSAKKHVVFANTQGKSLTSVKHIEKSGKGKKISPAKRHPKPALLDPERMERRRKAAEYAAKSHVMNAERKLRLANNTHKQLHDLMKSASDNPAMKKHLNTAKKNLDSVRNVAKIDLNMARNKLKAQRKLG